VSKPVIQGGVVVGIDDDGEPVKDGGVVVRGLFRTKVKWRRSSKNDVATRKERTEVPTSKDATTTPPVAPPPEQPAVGSEQGMTWQEAAERTERLRSQGEQWPGYREMAKRLNDCSTATVSKAVRSSPELTKWAKPQAAPRAKQSLDRENNTVADNATQQREPDPQEDVADAELRQLVEDAEPEERAFLNEIRGASRAFLHWYIGQTRKNQARYQKKWKENIDADPKFQTWFLSLPPHEQIDHFDDPASYHKSLPRP
jgi:hypothetical protein